MDKDPTILLAASYTFKTILRIKETEYKEAQKNIIQDAKDAVDSKNKNEVDTFFESISKPNNYALFHMILTTTLVGVYENFEINSDMPNLKTFLKSSMIKNCNTAYDDIDLKYIVRRLRNSVSHYNYKFENDKFIFEDDNRSHTDFFKAEFSHTEIATLVDEIAFYCVNNFDLK